MENKKVTIIGYGNIGSSIAQGLLRAADFRKELLSVAETRKDVIESLNRDGILAKRKGSEVVSDSNIIILAVKPYKVKEILEEMKSVLRAEQHYVVSLASGVTLSEVQSYIGTEIPVFRVMPNIASTIGQSMSCVASFNGDSESNDVVLKLFSKIGKAVLIHEELMDAATVLGACGTAFVLRFIRAMIQGGIQIGFDAKTAGMIVTQTVRGASEMLDVINKHPEEQIDKVTTPKGCTIVGLNEMEHQGFSSALIKGILTSYEQLDKN